MVVIAQRRNGEGSAMPTDPHHTPIITQQSSSQPQRKQKSRRPKEKDTEIPQSSVPSDLQNVTPDEAIIEEPFAQLRDYKFKERESEELDEEREEMKILFGVNDLERLNTFIDMDTKLVKESSKKAEAKTAQESSSKRAGEALE
ncbi:hypothetical protein Tco_0597441 [Tanacetum coccineum]